MGSDTKKKSYAIYFPSRLRVRLARGNSQKWVGLVWWWFEKLLGKNCSAFESWWKFSFSSLTIESLRLFVLILQPCHQKYFIIIIKNISLTPADPLHKALPKIFCISCCGEWKNIFSAKTRSGRVTSSFRQVDDIGRSRNLFMGNSRNKSRRLNPEFLHEIKNQSPNEYSCGRRPTT